MYNAKIVSNVTWHVYAFVEATAISGPACVYNVVSTNLVIVLSIAFIIPIVLAPLAFANFIAAIVSAVSPD